MLTCKYNMLRVAGGICCKSCITATAMTARPAWKMTLNLVFYTIYRVLPCLWPPRVANRLLKHQKPQYSPRKTEVSGRSGWAVALPCGIQIHKKSSPAAQKTFIFLGELRSGRGYFGPVGLFPQFSLTHSCKTDLSSARVNLGKLG